MEKQQLCELNNKTYECLKNENNELKKTLSEQLETFKKTVYIYLI